MKNVIKENLAFIILVFGYVLYGYMLQWVFGIENMMNIKYGYLPLTQVAIIISASFLIVKIVKGETWDYINLRSILGFCIIFLLLVPFKSTFASIKQAIPEINDFSWDLRLSQIDFIIHFGNHPWQMLWPIISNEYLLRIIDTLYMVWFIVLIAISLTMAWSKKRRLRYNYFITTLLIWIVLGSFLGTIFSSGGPCYFEKITHSEQNPYQDLISKLQEYNLTKRLWAVQNQIGLWNAKLNNKWLPFGGISAMPSIHVAMSVLFAIVGFHINRFIGLVFIIYVLLIQIGSVALGWHYAIDGYVSVILTIILWKIVSVFKIDIKEIGKGKKSNNNKTTQIHIATNSNRIP